MRGIEEEEETELNRTRTKQYKKFITKMDEELWPGDISRLEKADKMHKNDPANK